MSSETSRTRLLDIFGGFACLLGQALDFTGDDGKLFARFTLHEVDIHYSIAGKHATGTRAKELIITNSAAKVDI